MSLSKPTLFSDIPPEIRQLITKKAGTKTKLSLRQCSKQFRDFVDETVMHYKEFRVVCLTSSRFDITLTSYATPNARYSSLDVYEWKNVLVDKALQIWNKVFSTPKLKIDHLILGFGFPKTWKGSIPCPLDPIRFDNLFERQKILDVFGQARSNLPEKILVADFQIRMRDRFDDIAFFLKHLRPGTLKRIAIENDPIQSGVNNPIDITQISELEQWKEAKYLQLDHFVAGHPLQQYTHFQSVALNIDYLSIPDVNMLLSVYRQKPIWYRIEFFCKKENMTSIDAFLARLPIVKSIPMDIEEIADTRKVRMLGSNQFVIIKKYFGSFALFRSN